MKRAFTLIELLVVIAIIAILAAILFPVFARAKTAAKASASLSNAKQQTLAIIMYEGDFNDKFPLSTAWNTGNDPLGFGTGETYSTWVYLVQPYVKNAELFQDPLAPGVSYTQWTRTVLLSLQPTYGYNYTALSPFNWSAQLPSVSTTAARPADLVMLVEKWAQPESSTIGITQAKLLGGWYGGQPQANVDNGPVLNVTVDQPNCYVIPPACEDNWGEGSVFVSSLGLQDNMGGNTGGLVVRGNNLAITTFMDGHAKTETLGFLAQGTNWYPGIPVGNLTWSDGSNGEYPPSGTNYHWDMRP
jgi:prepilin-type N-terminal cleavage/methylation domain-containing protein